MLVEVEWKNKMLFEGMARGLKTAMDASPDHGGQGLGPTPKELLLESMCGCSAMDVVSILEKMRQKISHFKMDVDAKKNQEPPVYFTEIKVNYRLSGEIEKDKAIKAVSVSMSKYCGVSYMISKSSEISYEIYLNNESIYKGVADFVDPEE